MILASSIYNDVIHQISKEENGDLSYSDFNRLSKRAELRLLYLITGDIKGGIPPEPYLTQKNKDWLAPLITKYSNSLDANAQITRPADYYGYENMYSLSSIELEGQADTGCDEDGDDTKCDDDNSEEEAQASVNKVPIELLDGQQFYYRAKSYISGLRPSKSKPIAKEIGRNFEFLPTNLAGVTLEYVRYPVFAEIKTSTDIIYNDLIVNEGTTINYEWDESVRETLVYIIVDLFANRVREQSLKQFNEFSQKQTK